MHSVPKSAVLPYASGVGGLSRRLLNKDSSRAHNTVPIWSPMSTLNMALQSKMMTVAHIVYAKKCRKVHEQVCIHDAYAYTDTNG